MAKMNTFKEFEVRYEEFEGMIDIAEFIGNKLIHNFLRKLQSEFSEENKDFYMQMFSKK